MTIRIRKDAWVAHQTNQARSTGWVTTRKGVTLPVWCAFRCLYCGEYFNQAEAEEHFGKTREEFNKDAPPAEKIEVETLERVVI